MRPLIRAAQRVTKETMTAFVLIGAMVLLGASWRRLVFILVVPLYYLLVQSFTHTEFRYTLPMHYFLFILAAVVWVLVGHFAWKFLTIAYARVLPRPR